MKVREKTFAESERDRERNTGFTIMDRVIAELDWRLRFVTKPAAILRRKCIENAMKDPYSIKYLEGD
jgi:hypothetical protein